MQASTLVRCSLKSMTSSVPAARTCLKTWKRTQECCQAMRKPHSQVYNFHEKRKWRTQNHGLLGESCDPKRSRSMRAKNCPDRKVQQRTRNLGWRKMEYCQSARTRHTTNVSNVLFLTAQFQHLCWAKWRDCTTISRSSTLMHTGKGSQCQMSAMQHF